MTGTKDWYKSKGVWGGIVSLVAFIGSLAGYVISAEDQIVLTDVLFELGGILGSIGGIYGRVVAEAKIGKTGAAQ